VPVLGVTRTTKRAGAARTRVVRVAVVLATAMATVLVGAQAALASVWALQDPVNPSGSIGSGLSGVSCASGTYCVAIGSYESSGSVFSTFAEVWNGSSWALQSVPSPTTTNLNGVDCLSSTSCFAVGDQTSGSDLATLAEYWNGSAWTTMTTPNPTGGTRDFLISVSCVSSTECTSVGGYYDSTGDEYVFSETLSGTTWTLHLSPYPTGATTSQFNGVACTSSTSCVAVGYYLSPSYTGLAEYWNGSTWTIEATPLPSGGSQAYFGGVACMSATSCFATGDYNNGTKIHTLSEFWNGSSWSPQTTPAYTKEHATGLTGGVSCTPGYCTAVGFQMQKGPTKTLAEHWKQTFWEVQTTQNVSGAEESSLAGVSCWADDDCLAVGFYENGEGEDIVLAEQATFI
jgi:hypothetical protein